MKRQTKTYFRSFYITLVILLCVSIAWIGITTAWENIIKVAFGRYDKAVEITDNSIRILDFIIK